MTQEEIFAKAIDELVALAVSQGNVVSKEQVEDIMKEAGMASTALEPVYEFLKAKKIGVGEKVDLEEYMTKDEVDYVNMYVDSLMCLPNYSDGEKEAFYMSAMAGDRNAKDRVVEIMLPDIVDMAKLYAGQGVLVEDLIGEGNIAVTLGVEMLGALEKPSEVPGMLGKMVMDAMEEAIAGELDEKKADEKMASKVNKVNDAAKELAEELGRKITVDELANEGKLSKKVIEDAIRLSGERITYFEGSKD